MIYKKIKINSPIFIKIILFVCCLVLIKNLNVITLVLLGFLLYELYWQFVDKNVEMNDELIKYTNNSFFKIGKLKDISIKWKDVTDVVVSYRLFYLKDKEGNKISIPRGLIKDKEIFRLVIKNTSGTCFVSPVIYELAK